MLEEQQLKIVAGIGTGKFKNQGFRSATIYVFLYEELRTSRRFFMLCCEAIWANPDRPHGR